MLCYGQQGGINGGSERPACLTCVLCDKESSLEPNYPIRYLTMARRIVRIMQKQSKGKLATLIRAVGGSDKRSREIVDLVEKLGLIAVHRNERPYDYTSKLEAKADLAESLFSSDTDILRKLIGGPFSARISKRRHQQQQQQRGNP
ncbi:hypothetical protein GGI05_003225 [Coemansia sp. RSA 2603]|nr:hypothetical protein GGI05_003225 [Coemansia sp. RSA 2603]